MKKVAIYCRVSTDEQKERGSIKTQIAEIESYCRREDYIIGYRYLDDGISGSIPFDERPRGKQLLADAKEEKFDTLIVWKLDRLARKNSISATLKDTLMDFNINILSVTENFDFQTSEGSLMFAMQSAFSQHERDKIRERSIAGTNRVVAEGKWPGGIMPYGYKMDEGFPAINEDSLPGKDYSEADIIRKIYKWIGEDGLSTIKTAEGLNDLGVPTHYGKNNKEFYKPLQNYKKAEREEVKEQIELSNKRKVRVSNLWIPARIGTMIKNPMYRGLHKYGKRIEENK